MAAPKVFNGFEYARVVFIILIVLWHTVDLESINGLFDAWFYYNFCLLGVPVFFIISLFLFDLRVDSKAGYLASRVGRITSIYAFWVLVNIAVAVSSGAVEVSSAYDAFRLTQENGLFFLANLLLLYAVSYLVRDWAVKTLYLSLAASSAAVILTPLAVQYIGLPSMLVSYVVPVNYLPLVFLAAIAAARRLGGGVHEPLNQAFKYFLLYCVASLLEWVIYPASDAWAPFIVPTYMRMSLVFGAAAVFYAALETTKRPGRLASYISNISLGIYLMHFHFIELDRLLLLNPSRTTNFILTFSAPLVILSAIYVVRRKFMLDKVSFLFFRSPR